VCILRDLLPQPKNPRALCRGGGGALSIYMFPCSHGNISFLRNDKEGGNKKKSVVYVRGGEVPVLVCSLEIQQHPRAHTLKWPLPSGECTCTGTSSSACNVNARFHLPYSVQPILVAAFGYASVLL